MWTVVLRMILRRQKISCISCGAVSIQISDLYFDGDPHEQWVSCFPEESKRKSCREVGRFVLSVTGLNPFYYVSDFTDMRYKHSCVFIRFV